MSYLGKIWAWADGRKRSIAAALASVSAAGHGMQAVLAIWDAVPAWFPKGISTVDYLAGAIGALGLAHAAYKQQAAAVEVLATQQQV